MLTPIIFIISLISNSLQLAGKPQDTKVEQVISLFNECMTSIYIYTQMCLTDFGTLDDRDSLGIALFAIMIFTFSVNLIKVIYCLGKDIIQKCKEAYIKVREGSDRVISLKGNQAKIYVMEQSKIESLEVSRIEKVESVISERQNLPKLENKPVRTAHNNRRLLKKPL